MVATIKDTVAGLAATTGKSKAEVTEFLAGLKDHASACAVRKEQFKIPGLGTFTPYVRKATTRKMFGENHAIPAKGAVKFKADSGLASSIST